MVWEYIMPTRCGLLMKARRRTVALCLCYDIDTVVLPTAMQQENNLWLLFVRAL
jgi:hypothetical protein